MKLDANELRQIKLPYLSPFETSSWVETANNAIIVKLMADGVVGWGESAVMSGPWYNEETSNSAMVVMRDQLAPMLLEADLQKPQDADKLFDLVRGNRLGRSGLEFAVWDLFAKMAGKSLSQMLGGTRDRVAVGVSVGIQKDIDTLIKVVGGYVESGYARVKLKIRPGWDIEPTRAVRQTWPDLKLQVDANSIYTLEQADQLAKLDEFDLLLIEQPLAHDDIFDHAKLQKQLKTPICLDESIVSPEHARWAIEMQAAGVINIKPGRIGGFAPSIEVHNRAQAAGIPVWHGGMLESGIGRTGNVALASLPNFSLPGDISANARYFARDIVHNPFTLNADSTLTVPTVPGCGAEVDEDYLEAVTVQKLAFRQGD